MGLRWLAIAILFCELIGFVGEVSADPLDEMPPVMVSLTQREPPSDDEWRALHEDSQRAGLFGSLGDLKSQTVSFMNTRYYTLNSAEGTLASYGKMSPRGGFDRYGHIAGVEFDIPRNSWKERYAVNAAALVKLAGKARFAEFAGVELDAAVHDQRQIEITFVGAMAPKDEAIRRLNADVEALDYLGTLHEKRSAASRTLKLLGGSTPPAPKVVLANVMMLDARSSKLFDGQADVRASTVIRDAGAQLQLTRRASEETTLLTPVVRCYRTYSIEFKTTSDGRLERAPRVDAAGNARQTPIIFDLTPDL
jgi:hypothetical protein